MMNFLRQIFTWWNGATLNTRFFTWRNGEHVGTDALGNRYYRAPSAIPDSIAERRWVIYSGYSEASQIPPVWHGWMHHRMDTPPTDADVQMHEWQKPHTENMTGTAKAYRPAGSIARNTRAHKKDATYQAWRPE